MKYRQAKKAKEKVDCELSQIVCEINEFLPRCGDVNCKCAS
jgi:hypothetical protein